MAEKKLNEAPAEPKAKSAAKPAAKATSKAAKSSTSAKPTEPSAEKHVPRLKVKYLTEIKDQMREQFGYKNVMEIPRFEKIVVNMGVGEAATDSKAIEGAIRDLRTITGQQPMVTRARKSIAAFRLRAGMPIGAKVTLRADRMWEFFDRLMSVAIPRIRDFRGVPTKSFDGRGNFSMGVTEQLIFPEVDYDSIDHTRGMDITFVTTAKTDEEAKALMGAFGFPFQK